MIFAVSGTPISLEYNTNMMTIYWGSGGVVGHWVREDALWVEQTGNIFEGDFDFDEFWAYLSSILEEMIELPEEIDTMIESFKKKIEDSTNGSREIDTSDDARNKSYGLEFGRK
jgi:hypothetical protein